MPENTALQLDPALARKFETMGWEAVNAAIIDLTLPEEEDWQACQWLSGRRDPPPDPVIFRKLDRLGGHEVHARLVHGRFSDHEAPNAMLWLYRQCGDPGVRGKNHLTHIAGLGLANREGREKWLAAHPYLRFLERLGAWHFNRGRAVGMPEFANIRVLPKQAFDPQAEHLLPTTRPDWRPADRNG